MTNYILISHKIYNVIKKMPKMILRAIKYLIVTRDIKGFLRILKTKLYHFLGPEVIWKIHVLLEKINISKQSTNSKVHFLTFYTQGMPHDDGINLQFEAKELLRKTAPFVDSVKAFSAAELKNNPSTSIYVKEFQEEAQWNFKTNKIGFLRWKPYILLEELKKMRDGDILFYRDCNITKYPNILTDIHNVRKNVLGVLDYIDDDIFTPVELFPKLKVKNNVKVEVLQALNILNESNMEAYLHNASIFICRKSKKTIEFLSEWLDYCMDDELISPSVVQIQHCDFMHNTQEQAIMNGVLLKNGFLSKDSFSYTQGLSIVDRVFSIKKLVKVPRVAVLYCGQLRNWDNSELLKMNSENILGRFNCDVFASVWEERGYSFHHGEAQPTLYASNKDVNPRTIEKLLGHSGCTVRTVEIESFDEWILDQEERIQYLYNEGMMFGDKKVKATSFPQLYKIYKANKLKKEYETEKGFKYDLVIRMRPDMGFVETLPESYINDELMLNSNNDNIYHLNPPKIYYPNRIYDILFWGHSEAMDKICSSWLNINDLLDDEFDNGLPAVDCCRLLYIQARKNYINVIDTPRCIGDIYRDENIEDYKSKILNVFN